MVVEEGEGQHVLVTKWIFKTGSVESLPTSVVWNIWVRPKVSLLLMRHFGTRSTKKEGLVNGL